MDTDWKRNDLGRRCGVEGMYNTVVGSFEVPQAVLRENGVDERWRVKDTNFMPDETGEYHMFVTMERVL